MEISAGKYFYIIDIDDKLNLSICQVLQSTQKHIQMPKDIKSPHKPRQSLNSEYTAFNHCLGKMLRGS